MSSPEQASVADLQALVLVCILVASWVAYAISVVLFRRPRFWLVWFYASTFYLALLSALYVVRFGPL